MYDHWESKTKCSFFNLHVSTKIAYQTTADSSWRTTAYPAKWLLRNKHRNSRQMASEIWVIELLTGLAAWEICKKHTQI